MSPVIHPIFTLSFIFTYSQLPHTVQIYNFLEVGDIFISSNSAPHFCHWIFQLLWQSISWSMSIHVFWM